MPLAEIRGTRLQQTTWTGFGNLNVVQAISKSEYPILTNIPMHVEEDSVYYLRLAENTS